MPALIRSVGDRIRKHRLENGVTQAEVADLLGVTETAVGNWETNKTTPSARSLSRVAMLLGYEPAAADRV